MYIHTYKYIYSNTTSNKTYEGITLLIITITAMTSIMHIYIYMCIHRLCIDYTNEACHCVTQHIII